jgi:hypothetical protein
MKVGDVLVAVGRSGEEMQDVDGMEPDQVSSWIQGRIGESVRVKYQPAGTSRMRRTRFRQAMMEQVDGKWVFQESPDNMAVNTDSLSRMKSLEFRTDGTLSAEREVEDRFGGDLSGLRWLATRVDGETLFIDIESADEMIMYRVKVRFEDNHQAKISVSYDGLGQEGEFRDYRVSTEVDGDDDAITADISTRDSQQSTETDGNQ